MSGQLAAITDRTAIIAGDRTPLVPAPVFASGEKAGRGPSPTAKAGKTPVLAPEETRALLDNIVIATVSGLRVRAG
jgi:hypothetical protein